MLRPCQEAFFVQTSRKKVATMGHLWQKFVSERLRFTSSVAEFTAATWTTGCRRNASSRKSTTRETMGGRRRNDAHINTIVLAIAKTLSRNSILSPLESVDLGIEFLAHTTTPKGWPVLFTNLQYVPVPILGTKRPDFEA